jgi:hypothetical protein
MSVFRFFALVAFMALLQSPVVEAFKSFPRSLGPYKHLSQSVVIKAPRYSQSLFGGKSSKTEASSEPKQGGIAGRDELFGKIGVAGVLSNLVCGYSLYVLRTTSCGLPPGFLGLEGAVEGVSYLVVVGIFFWSILKKLFTGSGLWAGPFGLLGAAEGLSFLTVLGGIVIAALNLVQYGFLPGFLPNEQCFGIND